MAGDDPWPGGGAGQVTLADALLDRISDDDRATVERGLAENLRRTLLVLDDGESMAERDQYDKFAACFHRAYGRLINEVAASAYEVFGIWEKPTLGTALEKIDPAMLRQLSVDPDHPDQLADNPPRRVVLHVVVRACQATAGQAAMAVASAGNSREAKPNKGGRPTVFDWDAFDTEIVRVANMDGLPDTIAEMTRIMQSWCLEVWKREPAESMVKVHIRRIWPKG